MGIDIGSLSGEGRREDDKATEDRGRIDSAGTGKSRRRHAERGLQLGARAQRAKRNQPSGSGERPGRFDGFNKPGGLGPKKRRLTEQAALEA